MTLDTYTEAWRLECEARSILLMRFNERRAFLDMVGKKRGKEAQEKLEVEVKRIFNSEWDIK